MVLPVWNGQIYLAAAIRSILLQTHTDFELIVVDDGSTDMSASIAESFALSDPRVLVLRRPHDGFAAALNAALASARGEYIARMDADDVSVPHRLERQISFLRQHPQCVAVGSWVEVIDADGNPLGLTRFVEAHDEIVGAFLRGITAIAHPSVLVRRDALIAIGGYDALQHPSEDLDLWLRLIDQGGLANLPEPLLQYRRHEGAMGVHMPHEQFAASERIFNAARAHRGLLPLRKRRVRPLIDARARYHFECARIALLERRRGAAFRHVAAMLRRDPTSLLAYASLLACAVHGSLLRRLLDLRARYRASV